MIRNRSSSPRKALSFKVSACADFLLDAVLSVFVPFLLGVLDKVFSSSVSVPDHSRFIY